MKKLFVFMLVAIGLMVSEVNSFALEEQYTDQGVAAQRVIGEIAYYDSETKDIMVRDKQGKLHSIDITSSRMLEGFRIGDDVIIMMENGKVISIKKADEIESIP